MNGCRFVLKNGMCKHRRVRSPPIDNHGDGDLCTDCVIREAGLDVRQCVRWLHLQLRAVAGIHNKESEFLDLAAECIRNGELPLLAGGLALLE